MTDDVITPDARLGVGGLWSMMNCALQASSIPGQERLVIISPDRGLENRPRHDGSDSNRSFTHSA